MGIGEAVAILRSGGRVRRSGWNGVGMEVFTLNVHLPDTEQVETCLCLRTPNGRVQPGWNASTADLLADDWEAVERN